VAKFERRNGDPASRDVVFAFVNLQVGLNVQTPQGNWFNLSVDEDHDGVNDFGIQPTHLYNVKNIAAFTGNDPHRRGVWLWPSPRVGSDLLKNGIFVSLNQVPPNASIWATAPWEAQYLKLFDVSNNSAAAKRGSHSHSRAASLQGN
jgi:hypothetical protein